MILSILLSLWTNEAVEASITFKEYEGLLSVSRSIALEVNYMSAEKVRYFDKNIREDILCY